MIFHTPDTSLVRLKSCLKRADRFAKNGPINKSHALAPAFFNMLMFLDANDAPNPQEDAFDLVVLDWFAKKLDDFSKTSMIDNDCTVHAMLFAWQRKMPFGIPKKKK